MEADGSTIHLGPSEKAGRSKEGTPAELHRTMTFADPLDSPAFGTVKASVSTDRIHPKCGTFKISLVSKTLHRTSEAQTRLGFCVPCLIHKMLPEN